MAANKKSAKRSSGKPGGAKTGSGKAPGKTGSAGRDIRKPASPAKKAASAKSSAPAKAATRPVRSEAPGQGVVHSDVRRAALAWSFHRLR
jgi:hypothetical protein